MPQFAAKADRTPARNSSPHSGLMKKGAAPAANAFQRTIRSSFAVRTMTLVEGEIPLSRRERAEWARRSPRRTKHMPYNCFWLRQSHPRYSAVVQMAWALSAAQGAARFQAPGRVGPKAPPAKNRWKADSGNWFDRSRVAATTATAVEDPRIL
jgi:hypothetical protein